MSIKKALGKFFDEVRDPGITSLELRGNSLNNPSVPLSAAGFLAWAASAEPTASGEQVTLNTALQQITVNACVRVLSGAVASLPLYVYELTAGGRQIDYDHQLARMLRWEPNDEMTAFTLWESMVGALALTGNCYAEIQRDAGGRAVALWPLHPQLTEPVRTTAGDLAYDTTDGMTLGQMRRIPSADMIHVLLFSLNGLKGLSPIQMARQGIGLARAAEKYGARFFGNGARPSGVLTNAGTLTDKQKAEMKETWNQTQGGEHQGSIAVLPGAWTYTQIGISPEDAQFLATRNFQRSDIAAIWGVPPHMVGDTSRLSNNNAEQQSLSFVTDTLRPYLNRFESEIVRKLLPNLGRNAGRFQIEFDVSERLRGDFKTTMEGFAIGKQWGFLNTNDIHKDLRMNPIGPEGDIYWAPVNMQNAALLLETEPTLDQPIGSDPNADPDADADPNKPAVPTPTERQLLGRFTRGYIPVFRDAFSRLLKREKRDYDTVSALLGPVFRSIAASSMELNGSMAPAPAAIVEDVLRSIEKRASKWHAALDEGTVDALAQAEFVRALRSIHINVTRELAAAGASKQLALTEG
jgi:HK97 family phage portal protein